MIDITQTNKFPTTNLNINTQTIKVTEDYFANKSRNEIGYDLMKIIDDYYNYILKNGILKIWEKSRNFYYRGWMKGSKINRTGKQNEFFSVCVNEFRNIIQHLIVSVTSQRLEFEPKATNTDFKSQAQCIVANGILEHYNRVLQIDDKTKIATEDACCYGEGFVSVEWDETAGADYGLNLKGDIIKQGDIEIKNYSPIDVIRDCSVLDHSSHQWYILREWVNRYDVVVKYPELADRILNLGNRKSWSNPITAESKLYFDRSDLIPKYKFYHSRTPAVPNGRFIEFYDADVISLDGALPYEEVPIYRMSPDNCRKTPFGYSVAFELMPLQEILDGLYSIVVTNQATFGVQNIAMPKGASISLNALSDGLNLLTYDPKFGTPQALNLVHTPPEIFSFIRQITDRMETIAGLNSVVRGNPEASLKSGAALALIASQAIQFNSGLQQSYARFVENVGTAILNILKRYAKTPRMITIAGKSNRNYMSEFKSDDISNISRVVVNIGNPISRTTAGKLQIADTLLNHQLIKTPEQYLMVASTGRLEPLTENSQSQIMLIRSENEKIANGEIVQALVTDDHRLHILEHGVVLSSPESRQEVKVVSSALSHIQEHIEYLKTADPVLLELYGQPIATPTPNESELNKAIDVLNPTNPIQEKASEIDLPNMPNMPSNPLTGEIYDPEKNFAVPPPLP